MELESFEDEPRIQQESMLVWLYNALGIRYALLIPFVAFLAFVLASIIVIFGKSRWVSAALVLIAPMPMIVGMFGFFDGMIGSFSVIASSTTAPKPSELATGISMSLVAPLIGMLMAAPAYMVAVVGSFVRSLRADEPTK